VILEELVNESVQLISGLLSLKRRENTLPAVWTLTITQASPAAACVPQCASQQDLLQPVQQQVLVNPLDSSHARRSCACPSFTLPPPACSPPAQHHGSNLLTTSSTLALQGHLPCCRQQACCNDGGDDPPSLQGHFLFGSHSSSSSGELQGPNRLEYAHSRPNSSPPARHLHPPGSSHSIWDARSLSSSHCAAGWWPSTPLQQHRRSSHQLGTRGMSSGARSAAGADPQTLPYHPLHSCTTVQGPTFSHHMDGHGTAPWRPALQPADAACSPASVLQPADAAGALACTSPPVNCAGSMDLVSCSAAEPAMVLSVFRCVHVCSGVCACMVCACVFRCVCVYVCVRVHVHAYIYVCMCKFESACTCWCIE